MTAALEETGISPREYRVLLHALPVDLMQAQVAELSRLGKTTTVVTVDDLEKAGWAVRHPSPADRRVRIVTVTVTARGGATPGAEARHCGRDLRARDLIMAEPPWGDSL